MMSVHTWIDSDRSVQRGDPSPGRNPIRAMHIYTRLSLFFWVVFRLRGCTRDLRR